MEKKSAKRQKKLACGNKKKMDLLFIDVAGKRKRVTWLFTDVCEQCCDQGGVTLVGSVDASLSPGADRTGRGM